MVSQTWRRHWDRITPFFAYPAEVRKAIYTTNAVESLNMEAVLKLLYLALRNAS